MVTVVSAIVLHTLSGSVKVKVSPQLHFIPLKTVARVDDDTSVSISISQRGEVRLAINDLGVANRMILAQVV